MVSLRTRIENMKTRLLLKSFLNSNYEPARLRPRVEHGGPRVDSRRVTLEHAHLETWGDPSSAVRILYAPGGGFCFGPNDDYRKFLTAVSKDISAEVYLLNYRLAPEHPYPAALDDTMEALLRASEDGVALVVMGDSAGAALLLSALIQLRDNNRFPDLKAAVYLSAFTDLALTGLSLVSNSRRDPLIRAEALVHKVYHYLQGHNPTDPGVSPLWGNLRGLPPSLFIVGSTEVLYDDSVRIVERGLKVGCDFHLSSYDQAPHIFPINQRLPEALQAREEISQFLEVRVN
ncbi:MAG: alpha/beta hydrolase [Pseudomonadota bacterium]